MKIRIEIERKPQKRDPELEERIRRSADKIRSVKDTLAGRKDSLAGRKDGVGVHPQAKAKKRAPEGASGADTGAKAKSASADSTFENASLAEKIKKITDDLKYDIDAIVERDPASRSRAEAALLYSGFHALVLHRVAHAFNEHGAHFTARLISQAARFLTGIEIHPGATIGRGLFIDHGSGVVIGETAIVGDNCTIYQGVTLGGTGKETGKRHPTLGDNVMVGAGAKLLGNFTVGDNSKIAAGAVVLGEVPPDSTAVGIPAKVVRRSGEKVVGGDLDQTHIPDPVSQQLCALRAELDRLKLELGEFEKSAGLENVDCGCTEKDSGGEAGE